MNYFHLVSFDNTHRGIHLGANFLLLVEILHSLFDEAVLDRNGMAQA